jgi:hypothetical protein
MDNLARTLNITKQEEWYDVTVSQVKSNGGAGLLNAYGQSLKKGNGLLYVGDCISIDDCLS